MKLYLRVTKAALTAAIMLTMGTALFGQGQQKNQDIIQSNPYTFNNNDIPVADFDEPLPADSQESMRRQKEAKTNNAVFADPQPPNPKDFMITPQTPDTYGSPTTHPRIEPALPAKQSAAIVVGSVTSAKAYLSEDRINIFSEYVISNPVILKNKTSENLENGKSLFIIRHGGGVKFASGKIIYRYDLHKPPPKAGHKYLFFLDYFSEGVFTVITGYELTAAGVVPLDGLVASNTPFGSFRGNFSFKGVSESNFFNQVKSAIQTNSDVMTNGDEK